MNELFITINFTTQKFIINGIDLISGDYNSTKIKFNFEDNKEGTKILEIRPLDSETKDATFMTEIINNEVILVSKTEDNKNASPFTKGGTYLMEVSLYGDDDSKLSTITKHFNVLNEEINVSDELIEPYLPIFDELMQEINKAINEASNINIDIEKVGLTTTITIKNRDGIIKTAKVMDGVGIYSIDKIGTSLLTDTYRITLTNATYFDYQITNGRGIVSIEKTSTLDNVDTYTITYNDGTTSTFTVTNGTLTKEELYKELDYITNILPKVSDEGTDLTLDDTGDSRLLSLNVDGKSYQETQNEVIGKNLLCLGEMTSPLPTDITITKINNSSIQINGTATTGKTITYSLLYGKTLTSNDYTLFIGFNHPINENLNIGIPQSSGLTSLTVNAGSYSNDTTSNTENSKIFTSLNINIPSGTIFSNTVIQLQYEQNSTFTGYQTFTRTPPKPSPELESPILSVCTYNSDTNKYNLNIISSDNSLNTSTKTYSITEPLRSIGDIKDELYIENSILKVKRNINKVVLNGNESYTSMGWETVNKYGYRTSITDLKQTTSTSEESYVKSNYYKSKSQSNLLNSTENYGIANRANNSQIIIRNDNCLTANALKTWLNNNNTEVIYVKTTPTIETIGEVNLPITYYDLTYIYSDDSLEPNIRATALKDISNL